MPAGKLGEAGRDAAREVFANHYAQSQSCQDAARAAGISLRTARRWRSELAGLAAVAGQLPGRPSELTSFIGREELLRTLFDRLAAARLLTLTGPPGVGKTRLAARLQHGELDEPLRVLFCDLRSRSSDLELCIALGAALEMCLAESGELQAQIDAVARGLAALGPAVVILDNFEQLPASSAEVVVRWLERAPSVRFVVTSRRLLRVLGEIPVEVPPLALPETDEDAGAEAVRLFEDRARAVEPSFAACGTQPAKIVALVRRLEGIPLAIELAAAQMRRVSPTQLLATLTSSLELQATDSREPRHQTLRAAIDGSWNLLSDRERRALVDLSVFEGSFTADAAGAVLECQGDTGPNDGAAVIESLRAASLVRVCPSGDAQEGELRWMLFDAIRDYAATRSEVPGGAHPALERHANYYLRWGEERVRELTASDGPAARSALVAEVDNLRRAFDHLARDGVASAATVARMAQVLHEALRRWLPAVSVDLLNRAIHLADDSSLVRSTRARLRIARATSLREIADYAAAIADLESAEKLLLEGPDVDRCLLARVDYEKGSLHLEVGKHGAALERLTCALREAVVSRSRHLEGLIRRDLGWTKAEMLDPGAFDEYAKAATIFSSTGNLAEATAVQVAWCAHRVFFQRGNPSGELGQHVASLRTLRNRWLESQALNVMGTHCLDQGAPETTLDLCARALALAHRFRLRRTESAAHAFRGVAFHETGRLDEALLAYEQAIEVAAATSNARSEGINRVLLAGLLAQQGDVSTAEKMLGRAYEILVAIGDTVSLRLADLQRAQIELALSRRARLHGNDEDARFLRERVIERIGAATSSGDKLALTDGNPEARSIVRILRQQLTLDRTVWVQEDGSGFRVGGAPWVELPQGPIIRRALASFAQQRVRSPGDHLSIDALLVRCWPGERVVGESGERRVRQVVKRLRRAGLETALLTAEAGYLLDPKVPVRIVPSDRSPDDWPHI